MDWTIIMTIYEKNGKFYSRFKIHGRQKHILCQGATNRKQAQSIEDAEKFKLRQELAGIRKIENKVKLAKLLRLYDDYSKTNNLSYGRNSYVKVIGDYFGKEKLVEKIKVSEIDKFKIYLKEKRKCSNSTVNKYLHALSKMYNLGIAEKIINYNPVADVQKLREENHKVRFLLEDEQKRMLEIINKEAKHIESIVITALQTGMRKGEIFNLKWRNIDFKYNHIELLQTKSNKTRKIPISPVMLEILNKQSRESDYVFINPETNKPYTDIKHSFSSVLKKANIENFRFHDLRHTVATRLAESGVDLVVVKELLGHSKIDTTMRYAHAVPKRKVDAINALNEYFTK